MYLNSITPSFIPLLATIFWYEVINSLFDCLCENCKDKSDIYHPKIPCMFSILSNIKWCITAKMMLLLSMLERFFDSCIYKHKQAKCMSDLGSECDSTNVVLQVYFAENSAISKPVWEHSLHRNHEEPLFSQLMYGYQTVRVRLCY